MLQGRNQTRAARMHSRAIQRASGSSKSLRLRVTDPNALRSDRFVLPVRRRPVFVTETIRVAPSGERRKKSFEVEIDRIALSGWRSDVTIDVFARARGEWSAVFFEIRTAVGAVERALRAFAFGPPPSQPFRRKRFACEPPPSPNRAAAGGRNPND